MKRWSADIVKHRVDEAAFTLGDEATPEERLRVRAMRFACEGTIAGTERIGRIRAALAKMRKEKLFSPVERAVAEAVLAELEEIGRDLAFASSRHGAFILFVNDWMQPLHATLRANPAWRHVLVGTHQDKQAIVVAGRVAVAGDLVALLRLLAEHDPGAPFELRVEVGSFSLDGSADGPGKAAGGT